ncbi:CCA tRNA nucleotidyltransferase [Pontibacillus sp. ALD_SL1]|uniref:CCA tRNA nucleotidyltransferase n=1 Tax=Pontibacillus sp. ALD_SL1 TaxID=2777185 RepID=UPI001A964AE0|nr:CCA tRNA nucleotidyltransferase [Pontibacillus sp. ALD_SL1]QSS98445.1 CCA tRNA nucleotidyltransferase [Pontibacillus sp. ALD_SL1]
MNKKLEKPFLEALPVLFILMKQGHEAYFVGGSVRDHIMEREIGDIDIATSARPEQVQALFEKVIPVGIDHGTVVVNYEGNTYEVTTYRVDGEYNDYRHPDEVKYVATIEEDLSRRDFTMNAIAMSYKGEFIDPYGGKESIVNRSIETVRDAAERFQEDPLRMMRALRFTSQLGFTISRSTFQAVQDYAYLLDKIAVERIAVEFEKFLMGEWVQSSFEHLIKSNLPQYMPVFTTHPYLMDKSKELSWEPLNGLEEAFAIFVLSSHELSVSLFSEQWKCSRKVKKESEVLVKAYNLLRTEPLKWVVYQLGKERLISFKRILSILKEQECQVETLREISLDLPISSKSELSISGNDMKNWFPDQKPGPWIKAHMDKVERAVVIGHLKNEKEAIEMWVKQWNQQEGS